ncbi:PREDICTED: uncharacterized protein LOC106786510 [Polistes canadensis]|uniref:uncharacterized protein LOC106786510 n=1 Tax=Polistes canadensis TaxID=91411 RepID=UPI000718BCC1|nr:PREDICTED: uncharacterized protein LOC106786510 [Polistes canadensis]
MENIILISWLNKILLLFCITSIFLCLIIQQWVEVTPVPIYISLSWTTFVMIMSIWLSCILLRFTLKRTVPINIEFIKKWIYKRLPKYFELEYLDTEEKAKMSKFERACNNKIHIKTVNPENTNDLYNGDSLSKNNIIYVDNIIREINVDCIDVWYKNISTDKAFPNEAQTLLKILLRKIFQKANSIDKIKLANKLADVVLLHLKEYRRALRRVEKGTCTNLEEAYRCLHPGSRSLLTLEHIFHRLVTVLTQEFLQWELTSSLPCKLLVSILARKLLTMIQTISCPNWMFESLLKLLQSTPKEANKLWTKDDDIVSIGLSDGITSAVATVIPCPLLQPAFSNKSMTRLEQENQNSSSSIDLGKRSLSLEGLRIQHRGLWGDINISEVDSEIDNNRISPIYEEPTDFATTIARLRNLLQQKSTATTPLRTEDKSYVIYEGNQFINLCIPWTEFHTTIDGSQQLLYCIQFDDVEQRGVDLFETTTATVKRQHSDFVQLHTSLEEIPSIASIMSELELPEGGRVEMETYLRNLCIRLANECPTQLRHFLRPNSNAGKKADIVAPRFDRILAKTVSGVFNTLKTVVPRFELDSEEEVIPLPTLIPLSDIPWRFVEDIKSKNLAYELQQLVAERIYYCSVDTAYEAVDSMEGSGDSELMAHWWNIVNTSYDEETEELDSKLSLTCVVIDLICEVLTGIGSNNVLQQEAVVRWAKLLFGNITEPLIEKMIMRLSDSLSDMSFTYNSQSNVTTESALLTKDKIFEILKQIIPCDMKLIFGEEDTLKIFKYLLTSYEIRKINLDLNMQILDVLMSQLLISCRTNHDAC